MSIPGAITVRTLGVFLVATWPRRLLLGSLLLLPCLVAILGGFSKAEGQTREVAPATWVDLGPMQVRPVEFFVSAETERSDLEVFEGEAWLGVVVEVENTTRLTYSLTSAREAGSAIVPQLPQDLTTSISWAYPRTVLRLQDASPGQNALPDVPTEIVYMWPITDADAVGDRLDLSMVESEFRYGPLSGQDVWMNTDDSWTTTLSRTELPQALVEPEEDW